MRGFLINTIYKKFVSNSGEISIDTNEICIGLKKKRELPEILDFLKNTKTEKYPWLKNKIVNFFTASSS